MTGINPTTEAFDRRIEVVVESERALLACVLSDPGNAVAAVDSGLLSGDFYRASHSAIFAEVEALASDGEEPADWKVVTNLRAAGNKDAENEAGHLSAMGVEMMPGVVQTRALAATVRIHSQRRRAVRESRIVAEAIRTGDDAAALEATARLAEIASAMASGEGSADDAGEFSALQKRKFDPENLTPEKEPLLSLKDIPIIYSGNLMTLVGHDKSGKSHVAAAIAKAISEPGTRHLGFSSISGGRIAYIDCEQDRSDFEGLLIRSGCDADKVAGYHLTGFSAARVLRAITAILKGEPELRALFLDGYADLLQDVNDSEAANALVSGLMSLAEEYEVAIIGVLHLNPGSEEKSRGHLGSQLGRKSQTVLQVKVQGDGSRVLFTQRARKRAIPESLGLRFGWDDSIPGFAEITGTLAEIVLAEKVEEWERTLRDIEASTGMLAWKYGDLVKEITIAEGVKERTAKTRIRDFLEAGLIKHSATDGIYTSTLGD